MRLCGERIGLPGTVVVHMNRPTKFELVTASLLVLAAMSFVLAGLFLTSPAQAAITGPTPIQHVVIVDMENHSFDNVLGKLCVLDSRCDGAASGVLPNRTTIPLSQASNTVPEVNHTSAAQHTAIDHGKMDGFGDIAGCTAKRNYRCYSQFDPSQVPNLAALARQFAISDRTFEMDAIPSWGAHLELVAQTLDNFVGDNPSAVSGVTPAPGWGCDSNKDAVWKVPRSGKKIKEPSCVPDYNLDPVQYPYGGAYRATDVGYVPTIMDRLNDAGLSWKLYTGTGTTGSGYSWAICPTFAECLYTNQRQNMVGASSVITDAQNGALPNFSVVIPTAVNSQHNRDLMDQGDNWLGSIVSAIEEGPQWASTAVFITYDDCGCFYDHVPPPKGLGIRVPMVIASPYAKPGFTDSNAASFSSMLAFTEHVFGLPALSGRDAAAYDFSNSFNFGQANMAETKLAQHPLSQRERRYLETHRELLRSESRLEPS
jgi:phospholipase C